MSVWKKLITAVKGGANEAAQSVVDSQAIRILEQEIREAKEELRKSDHARTQILAKFGLTQQGGPGSHVMRQPSVASAESGGGSSAMRLGEARRRKPNKERDAEILDEVAV